MPRKLHVSASLSLPLDYATETGAIVAKKGAGKTYTASVQAEEFLKCGIQIAIIDPTGAWWGLRASEDGKSDGYPIVIFGGLHGDLPLDEASGVLLARTVMESAVSAVIDLDGLSQGAQRRIVQEFCETLYQHNRHVIHLFIDEADAFVPQRIWKGQERCFKAVDDVVRRGRKKGIGTTLISQRTAAINKDVLTQAETLFVLRTTHPRDLAPIEEWVRAHDVNDTAKTMMADLPTLSNGEAFVWSPEVLQVFKRIKVRQRETFNSSATPKVGERPRRPKRLAPVDLERLRDQFAQAVEKARHDDPKLLREALATMTNKYEHLGREYDGMKQHLAEVERDRDARLLVAQKALAARKERVVPAIGKEEVARLERVVVKLDARAEDARIQRETLLRVSGDLRDGLKRAEEAGSKPAEAPPEIIVGPPPASPAPQPKAVPRPRAESAALGVEREPLAGEMRMLEALKAAGSRRLTLHQVAICAGVARKSGTFRNYWAHLKQLGYVVVMTDDTAALTDAGRAFVKHEVVNMTFAEIWGRWLPHFLAGEIRILQALLAAGGGVVGIVERGELGKRVGIDPASGTWRNYMARVKRSGLVEKSGNGYTLTPDVFVFGRPSVGR